MNSDFREGVYRAGFRPTAQAEALDQDLRPRLGLKHKYDCARLCIGRSLAVPESPAPVPSTTERGKPLPGDLLFGDDLDYWLCVLILDSRLGVGAKVDDFRGCVEAHWARGAQLLQVEWENSGRSDTAFLLSLAEFLPEPTDSSKERPFAIDSVEVVRLSVGPISKEHPSGKPVSFDLNAPGVSPVIALMGKMGSGKTTTGVQLAKQIVTQSGIPMLFIDPKGEFVVDGKPTGLVGGACPDINAIEVSSSPIPLDFLPSLASGRTQVTTQCMALRDSIVACTRGAGNVQQQLLLGALSSVVEQGQSRNLSSLRDAYEAQLAESGKKTDSILGRLSELSQINVFEPVMPADEFFSRSWILSLAKLPDELKRLTMLLVLDSFARVCLARGESELRGNHRVLKHLLVIDEARRILSEKRYESLVTIVRQGRSKGQVVMLLSQDPSDFDGQADDFTTQLGAVVAFACGQSHRGLRALQGVYGRKLLPEEFSDTTLPTGVAFTKLPGREALRIQCWSPGINA